MPRQAETFVDDDAGRIIRAIRRGRRARFTPALDNVVIPEVLVDQANTVPRLRSSLNSTIEQAILFDPHIARQIGRLGRPAAEGVPRAQISVPICPAAEVTDQVLFEGAADPAQKFYLPRYRLATQVVSGRQQYRLALEERAASWQLVAYLEKFPAPELGAASQTATELLHQIAVFLRYRIAGSGGAQKELSFDEVTQEQGGMRAALTMASIAERDELYRAMTTEDYQAQLVVRRVVRVAVQVNQSRRPRTLGVERLRDPVAAVMPNPQVFRPIDAGTVADARIFRPIDRIVIDPGRLDPILRPTPLPKPVLVVKGTEDYQAGGQWWTRYQLSISNWGDYSDELFAPAPDLPPCGNNTNAARTWVDILARSGARLYGFCALGAARNLDTLWFAVERDQDAPPAVYVTLTDRRTNRSVSSDPVVLPVVPRFRELSAALDSTISPFLFSTSLHGYIFRNITPETTPGAGLLRWQVPWQGTFYTYYQEQARPHLFYYLPDQFKLARRPDGGRPPWMSVRIATSDGFRTEATTQVTFSYVVASFVDEDRLAAAIPVLAGKLSPSAGAAPQLEPLITDAVRFVIERPRTVGAVTEERRTASVALRSAIHDTLAMSLDDFQPLFEALIEPSATLFHGKVVVEVRGWPAEEIPFTARMDDMVGDVLTYAAVDEPAVGGLRVTLTNAIESPVRIGDLKAALSRGGPAVAAEIRELSLPVEQLAPGDSITFAVAPVAAVSGDGELVALFDLDQVRALPDAAAIWEAIVEEATSEYYRNVTVKAVPALFEPPAGRPDDQIVAIVVAFESGETIELTSSQLEAVARVDLPIEGVVLREAAPDTYSYRVITIRRNGQQQERRPAPRRDKLFYVDVGS